MKFTLTGCLALALLVSCGKKGTPQPSDHPSSVVERADVTAPAHKALPVDVVSPLVPPAPAPDEIVPDEEDPSMPDTDQITPPPGPRLTPGQRLDRAIEKTGKALQVAGEQTENGVDTAAEKTEKGLRKAARKTGQALQRAGEAIERNVPAGEPEPAPPGE